MQVLFDRVLIKRKKLEQKTASGLIIPDIAIDNEIINTGTIESVGEDCKKSWEIGTHVMFNKHSPTEVTINGVDYVIMKEVDVWCVL